MGHQVLRKTGNLFLGHPGGFSLVELMIAMTIMLILLLRGIPATVTWLQNNQIRSASVELENGLQLARAQAVQLNKFIQFQLVASGWSVSSADTGTALQSRSNVNTPQAVVQATQTTLVFNGLGMVVGSGGVMASFDISNPSGGACSASGGVMRCLRVTVQSGGQIRLCDPNLPTSDPQSC
jgi:type IV fimbrial biogenesis protein FimT